MKILVVLLVYLLSENTAETVLNNDVTTIDLVLKGLNNQSWEADESPCLDDTKLILNNARNYTVWAVWVWNSMQNLVGTFYGSPYNLGNYDQCLDAPTISSNIRTQYCLSEVKLTGKVFEDAEISVMGSTEPFLSTKTKIGRSFNQVTWGTCLPATCKHHSISKILKALYLANPITPSVPEISVESCTIAGRDTEFDQGFYWFILLITSLVAMAVYSTYYFQVNSPKSRVSEKHSVLNAFCLSQNWTSLTKKSKHEINFLNLLKLSVAILAVTVHTTFFEIMAPYSNGVKFDEFLMDTGNLLSSAAKHIDLPVDVFIMISGLLLVTGFMEKRKSPLVGLVNRYFRLMTTYAVIMFFMSSVSMHTGDGPVWKRYMGKEQKACSDNWLVSLFMLNNFINSDNICLIVSWYIPCDYQLAVMGTILYIVWQKNKTVGKVVTIAAVITGFLTPAIVTYVKKLPGLVLYHDIEKIVDFRKNEVYLDTYIRFYNRTGPYFIGMAMGYILHVYKPKDYRHTISKKASIILLAIASLISIKIISSPLSWSTLEYDHLSAAIFTLFRRNLWALSTCMAVVVVEYGHIGFIRKFIDWHLITILSRLTFGIYLTHSLVIQQYLYSRRNLGQFDLIYSEVSWTNSPSLLGLSLPISGR
ncbi:unnamed protein product [Chrysodeixis includens]|uniref:Nose resistant-to-fluoxetine protein N-terminal domain-containing protein n=1 Tax=Chrysodeixis includens TaxID=689277 RepID=A0A9P0BV79_CHRIL|nr:unnamed protein product [Chrysodeixis includens]